ncbi:hypothetical protein [Companilactobacillus paralimentarius]|uniref:hypothetical protein n=1 Tax=Companilactobacillus paralimentarius TaxID=83526 RepID=UPI001265EBA7|nr:hypothetical protein [Companilactobacillus paralimentarius]QFR70107.1 hypothetical protein LP238_10405 [Companilactobacillus paralimentarius]
MSNKFITKEFSIEKGTGRLSPIRLRPRDKKALENNDAIYIYLGPKMYTLAKLSIFLVDTSSMSKKVIIDT